MNEAIREAMTAALRSEGCTCDRPVEVGDALPVPGLGGLVLPEPIITHGARCPMSALWN